MRSSSFSVEQTGRPDEDIKSFMIRSDYDLIDANFLLWFSVFIKLGLSGSMLETEFC